MVEWVKPFITQVFSLCSPDECLKFEKKNVDSPLKDFDEKGTKVTSSTVNLLKSLDKQPSTFSDKRLSSGSQMSLVTTMTTPPENTESFKQITDLVIDYCTLNT